jgi:hypothetical protein
LATVKTGTAKDKATTVHTVPPLPHSILGRYYYYG